MTDIIPGVALLFTICVLATAQQYEDDKDIGSKRVTDASSALDFFAARNWIPSDGSASEIVDLGSYITNFQRYARIPVSGILDETTIDKMNSPKCGNADFDSAGFRLTGGRKKRYTRLGRPWSRNSLTWHLEGVTADLSESDIRREVAAAFEYWANVSPLTFREVNTPNADIIVNFYRFDHGDGSSFDGTGSTLAHAFAPGGGIGGDMHFDDDEIFVTHSGRRAGEVNFQQVAVHEIGHSLGLGHSDDANAIMAPFYQYRANLRLGSDDIAGIRALYGAAPRPPIRTNPPTRPTVTTPTPKRTLAPVHCNGEFDAASEGFDGDVYLFQGSKVFKVEVRDDRTGFEVHPNYPQRISREFPGVPDFVDAAFLLKYSSNKFLYIFKGNQYWRIQNGQPSRGYPKSISAWGLPGNIDGAFTWPGNGKIYFFKDHYYYRYNTMTGTIDSGYPRYSSVWSGVVRPMSAVLDYGEQSFFFNGQYFQEFLTSSFSVSSGNRQAARTWLGCQTEGLRDYGLTTEIPEITMMTTDSGVASVPPSLYVVVVTTLLSLLIHLSTA